MRHTRALLLGLALTACGTVSSSDDDDTADGDADADTDADGDTDADADTDADGDSDGDADADGDADVEQCNGEDDNGNGDIDEGDPGGGVFCKSGLFGSCALGRTHCVDGAIECVPNHVPGVDTCSNLGADDDCDGLVDDPVGEDCDTGFAGLCGVGVGSCDGETFACNVTHAASREICDNLRDEDCDGTVDEADCINRTNVMLCGASGRNISAFLPAEPVLAVENGCAPDETTQALFITRNFGAVDTQTLQDYLDGGGNVITEYNISATIFNQAFDDNVRLGANNGNCQDNVNPAAQLTPNDPFWQDNAFVAEASTGCGYDMQAYPGITPLGGWGNGSVSLAYRDRGLGRLWLVEADWQDGEDAFDQTSTDLMRYMLSRGL